MKQNPSSFMFSEFQEAFDKMFTEFVHNVPNQFLKYVKSKILETNVLSKNKMFQLELVVDTNILFSEVRSLMLNNTSFFLKIIDNPFIKVYAPSQIKYELIEKIKIKFPKEKQTRQLDLDASIIKANELLSKIEINDSFSNNSWEKAKFHLKDRDEKDISFVALNLSLKTHGVLTKDKDISDQQEINTWTLKDAGKVITEFGKGSFSFVILDFALPTLWEIIYSLVSVIWFAFIEIVEGAIKILLSIVSGSVKAIANMPPELALVVGLASILVLVTDELREGVAEFTIILWREIKKVAQSLKEFISNLWEVLKQVYEALKPFFNVSAELLIYLTLQSGQTLVRLVELEEKRPE